MVAESLDPAELTETLATLVDKSLLTSDRTTAMRYRLLDTTRAYAWQKLAESGEDLKIIRRHCEHMIHALEQFGAKIWAPSSPASIDFFVLNLGNLRAALEWSFSDQGDCGLGAKLTGASACLFFQAGLLPECAAWTERAIGALDTLEHRDAARVGASRLLCLVVHGYEGKCSRCTHRPRSCIRHCGAP